MQYIILTNRRTFLFYACGISPHKWNGKDDTSNIASVSFLSLSSLCCQVVLLTKIVKISAERIR